MTRATAAILASLAFCSMRFARRMAGSENHLFQARNLGLAGWDGCDTCHTGKFLFRLPLVEPLRLDEPRAARDCFAARTMTALGCSAELKGGKHERDKPGGD